jgi:hypothetical protein
VGELEQRVRELTEPATDGARSAESSGATTPATALAGIRDALLLIARELDTPAPPGER